MAFEIMIHEHHFFGGAFFFWSHAGSLKEGSKGRRQSVREQGTENSNIRQQRLLHPMFPEHVPRTLKPIARQNLLDLK